MQCGDDVVTTVLYLTKAMLCCFQADVVSEVIDERTSRRRQRTFPVAVFQRVVEVSEAANAPLQKAI